MSTRRRTIAVLTDWLDTSYHLAVLRGALLAAPEHEVRIVTYLASSPGNEVSGISPVHKLAISGGADGLILFASGVTSIGEAELPRFMSEAGSLPICTIATALPGASSVSVDNNVGFLDSIEHLVTVHRCQRIAYVGGPVQHPDAREREAVFRSALAHHGLYVDERLVVAGDFVGESGTRAVDTLLDERAINVRDLDAVVCANDAMAMGVLEGLRMRGVDVPDALAVVGFDDVPEARVASIPLTTVRQPLAEQGREAVRLVSKLMAGSDPEQLVLSTRFVKRRSCGCLEGIGKLNLTQADLLRRGQRSFEIALLERRDALLRDMGHAGAGQLWALPSGWERRLLAVLVDELKGISPDAFRRELDTLLRRLVEAHVDPEALQAVISVLWRTLIPCVMGNHVQRTELEGLLDGARLATKDAEHRLRSAEVHTSTEVAWNLVACCVALSSSDSLEGIAALVERRFPALGVIRLEVALLRDGPKHPELHGMLTFRDGIARPTHRRLLPEELPGDRRSADWDSGLTVALLDHEGEVYGAVLMALTPFSSMVHEALREAFSVALQNVIQREARPTIPG